MSVVCTWGSSLHKYSREYTFSTYPAETFVKDKEGYIRWDFSYNGDFCRDFRKRQESIEGE